MKKIFLSIMACLTLGLTSCSDDPMDATSKHVYGPNENPYLRTSTEATIENNVEFTMGNISPVKIDINKYAEKINKNMGMTVDELFFALESGKVVFHNINVSRGAWDKTAPTKDSKGWYYNTEGSITTETGAVASVELDKTARELIINVPSNVTSDKDIDFSVNIGFAVDNGKDYDNYIRFSITVKIKMPTT